jgi:hypothetical protein
VSNPVKLSTPSVLARDRRPRFVFKLEKTPSPTSYCIHRRNTCSYRLLESPVRPRNFAFRIQRSRRVSSPVILYSQLQKMEIPPAGSAERTNPGESHQLHTEARVIACYGRDVHLSRFTLRLYLARRSRTTRWRGAGSGVVGRRRWHSEHSRRHLCPSRRRLP